MYNEILTIGPVTIHGYGLMIGLGVMAALLLGDYRAKKFGLNGDHIYGMTFSAVILGFVAARILFIITEWDNFLQNPMQYLAGAGFVVYGGIIGGALTIYGVIQFISPMPFPENKTYHKKAFLRLVVIYCYCLSLLGSGVCFGFSNEFSSGLI